MPRRSRFQQQRGSGHNQSVPNVTTGHQALYPPPDRDRSMGGLFEVAAHRDWPFQTVKNRIRYCSSNRRVAPPGR